MDAVPWVLSALLAIGLPAVQLQGVSTPRAAELPVAAATLVLRPTVSASAKGFIRECFIRIPIGKCRLVPWTDRSQALIHPSSRTFSATLRIASGLHSASGKGK